MNRVVGEHRKSSMKAILAASLLIVLIFVLVGQALYALPAVAQDQELLQNGGFEQGESPWGEYCGTFVISSDYVHQGNYAAKFTLNPNRLEGWIHQVVQVVPGGNYNLVGYYDIESDPNIKRIFLRVSWYDEKGNLISWQEDSFEPGTPSTPSEPQSVEDAIEEMFFTDPKPDSAKVIRVIDGDTVELEDGTRVRYIGINTPELDDENPELRALAEEAKRQNEELVQGKTVWLKKDVRDKDYFGRLLRYVIVDDNGDKIFVNAELVRRGYAIPDPHPPDTKYHNLFLQLAQEAVEARRGIWASLSSEDLEQMEEQLRFRFLSVIDILAPDKACEARIKAGITARNVTESATVYFDDLSFSGPRHLTLNLEESLTLVADVTLAVDVNLAEDLALVADVNLAADSSEAETNNGQMSEEATSPVSTSGQSLLAVVLVPTLAFMGVVCLILGFWLKRRG